MRLAETAQPATVPSTSQQPATAPSTYHQPATASASNQQQQAVSRSTSHKQATVPTSKVEELERLLKEKEEELEIAAALAEAQQREIERSNRLSVIDSSHVTIGEVIGEGASAKVHGGTFGNIPVAIKVFRAGLQVADIMEDPEVQYMLKLRHPNIVQTFGVTQLEELLVGVVMEKANVDLEKLIMHKQTRSTCNYGDLLTYERKVTFANNIAVAVSYMHSYSLAHLDIKPLNILIFVSKRGDATAKISDLGLSAFTNTLYTRSQRHHVGTVSCMAPELWEEKGKQGLANDVWSLGTTIFEMFREEKAWGHPYVKVGPTRVPKAIIEKELPKTMKLTASAGLRDLLCNMLSFNPAQRMQMKQVVARLQALTNESV